MRDFKSGRIATFLVVVFIVNLVFFGLANLRAEAGFWDDNKGSIITVAKGFLLLWLINLMRKNATGNGGDDIITSTIKKGLNIGDKEPAQPAPGTTNSDNTGSADDTVNAKTEQSTPVTDNSQTVTPQNQSSTDQAVIIEDIEDQNERSLLELVNRARKNEGLNALEFDAKVTEIARKKARDMIDNDYFDHQSPTYGSPFEMLKAAGIDYSLAGENLAEAGTIKEAFDSLMASPEHRENILKARYDRIGLGIIKGGPYGLVIVQLFLDSVDPAR